MSKIVGDQESVTITITVGGTATDPTDLTLELKDPSGNTTTYTYSSAEITKDSTGVYSKTLPAYDEAGRWLREWQATGTVAGVYSAYTDVNPQAI